MGAGAGSVVRTRRPTPEADASPRATSEPGGPGFCPSRGGACAPHLALAQLRASRRRPDYCLSPDGQGKTPPAFRGAPLPGVHAPGHGPFSLRTSWALGACWVGAARPGLVRGRSLTTCFSCFPARAARGTGLCERRAPWDPRPARGDRTSWTPRAARPARPARPVRPVPVRLLRQPRCPPGEHEGPLEGSGMPGRCSAFLKLEPEPEEASGGPETFRPRRFHVFPFFSFYHSFLLHFLERPQQVLPVGQSVINVIIVIIIIIPRGTAPSLFPSALRLGELQPWGRDCFLALPTARAARGPIGRDRGAVTRRPDTGRPGLSPHKEPSRKRVSGFCPRLGPEVALERETYRKAALPRQPRGRRVCGCPRPSQTAPGAPAELRCSGRPRPMGAQGWRRLSWRPERLDLGCEAG